MTDDKYNLKKRRVKPASMDPLSTPPLKGLSTPYSSPTLYAHVANLFAERDRVFLEEIQKRGISRDDPRLRILVSEDTETMRTKFQVFLVPEEKLFTMIQNDYSGEIEVVDD